MSREQTSQRRAAQSPDEGSAACRTTSAATDARAETSPAAVPAQIEAELRAFEAAEARRLGLVEEVAHWHDDNPRQFTSEERGRTTLLFGGLTAAHDALVECGLRALGYSARALPCPDQDSLQCGKEFGNRGQCNPTYYTVGNLLQYLMNLRDRHGLTPDEIVRSHAFVTFGSCGPCRYGAYVTEYRKALRDAGFAGFRILTLSQQGPKDGIDPSATGLQVGSAFYLVLLRCLLAGDIINVLGYRTRPYEIENGATDAAVRASVEVVRDALRRRRSVLRALRRVRQIFAGVAVDRLQPKPKVTIIGEFWAMITEGEGNYRLQRFLEAEGAECDIQIITVWALYNLWLVSHDIRESTMLRRRKGEVDRYEGLAPRLGLVYAAFWRAVLKLVFGVWARTAGLKGYRLTDMDELNRLARDYYPNQIRGGEGHMEVGKVIHSALHRKAHMVVSVKPFGCMPSSGVSDGVQALVTARFPDIEFLPIETTGDSAVNAYSRVQMALFRARARAQAEFEEAMRETGLSRDVLLRRRSCGSALDYPRHRVVGTAANAVYDLR